MRRLARHHIAAVLSPIKRRAKRGEIEDMFACLTGDQCGDLGIDSASTGAGGINGMRLGAVAHVHRGGHTALRPSRACPLPQWIRGDHHHRARRQRQRRIKRPQPRTDDDDAVALDVLRAFHTALRCPACATGRSSPAPRDGPLRPSRPRPQPDLPWSAATTGPFPA